MFSQPEEQSWGVNKTHKFHSQMKLHLLDMLVVFGHVNKLHYEIQCHCRCTEMKAGCATIGSFMGHIRFSPVRVVGSAVKSFWMRSLLWRNQCKQCYQADCRRKSPSSAERSNLGSLSRWYFRLLDAGPSSLCGSRILKRLRTDEYVLVVSMCFLHTLNFIASSAGLRR